MGTNYYLETWKGERCPHCGRGDEKEVLHIGKASYGWTFSFHGTDEIRSWEDWKPVLRTGTIKDEYGRELTPTEFAAIVDSHRGSEFNHARDIGVKDSPYYRYMEKMYGEGDHWIRDVDHRKDLWLDPEGNSFSSGEFS